LSIFLCCYPGCPAESPFEVAGVNQEGEPDLALDPGWKRYGRGDVRCPVHVPVVSWRIDGWHQATKAWLELEPHADEAEANARLDDYARYGGPVRIVRIETVTFVWKESATQKGEPNGSI